MAWLRTEALDGAGVGTAAWPQADRPAALSGYGADSEHGRLDAVLLGAPDHLDLVPCNSVTCESIRLGRKADPGRAARQHAALAAALESEGVDVHVVPAVPGLPDLSFTRDTSLMTPWGMIGLAPGAPHRRAEVEAVLAQARAAGIPVLGQIDRGRIEGGDVAMIRPGLLAIGVSGERTDATGAEALATIFRGRGWRVVRCDFDPHFLHLDTQFCMVDDGLALGCTTVLDDGFLALLAQEGVELIDVSYKEARRLGCNILSLGLGRVLSAGASARIDHDLVARGYRVIRAELGQFVQCGGGVHCLTLPLSRAAG